MAQLAECPIFLSWKSLHPTTQEHNNVDQAEINLANIRINTDCPRPIKTKCILDNAETDQVQLDHAETASVMYAMYSITKVSVILITLTFYIYSFLYTRYFMLIFYTLYFLYSFFILIIFILIIFILVLFLNSLFYTPYFYTLLFHYLTRAAHYLTQQGQHKQMTQPNLPMHSMHNSNHELWTHVR